MATILIVDDRPTSRDLLITLLGYQGHRLLEAADGAEALKVARAALPDLIISDILMPTMDGYEFVRQLRAGPQLTHTRVIFSTAHPPLSPGAYARLTVQDTGHGMESNMLERIFEPFFTTKPVGEGTGLGLPVVHGIIAHHGGAITVTSVPRQGTTFDIYLPRCDNTSGENVPDIATIQGDERIPCVDDEEAETMGIQGYVMKPVARQELGVAIRQVFDRQSQ